MGQKVHPVGFRLGIIKDWDSRWYAKKGYSGLLHEDIKIREFLKKKLNHAGVSKIEIERTADKVRVNIHSARPGLVIGKKGSEIDALRNELKRFTDNEVFININEVRKAEIDSQLVAESIAMQMERRVHHKRAMKKAVTSAMKLGAKGIKILCSGRLGGHEMARKERYMEGRVPLHTLRADIDYGVTEALTTYGLIGVKVWIFKGEVLEKREEKKVEV